MTAGSFVTNDDKLKELVQRHQVCFESYPIWHVPAGGGKIAVGYELDLIGTHDHPAHPAIAGCIECRPVYLALVTLAQAIMPPNGRASRYVIEPYDVALHFSPRRKMRKDVIVAVDIVHRQQFDRSVDECEIGCLHEMQEKLKALGAKPYQW